MARGPAPIPWPTPGDQGHLRDHRELIRQIHELQDAALRHEETIAALFSMLHDCVSLLQVLEADRPSHTRPASTINVNPSKALPSTQLYAEKLKEHFEKIEAEMGKAFLKELSGS